jgi:hypothetical protein
MTLGWSSGGICHFNREGFMRYTIIGRGPCEVTIDRHTVGYVSGKPSSASIRGCGAPGGLVTTLVFTYDPTKDRVSNSEDDAASLEWVNVFLSRHIHGHDGPCTSFTLAMRVMEEVQAGHVRAEDAANFLWEKLGIEDFTLCDGVG